MLKVNRQTKDNRRSKNLTLVFSSCELKKIIIVMIKMKNENNALHPGMQSASLESTNMATVKNAHEFFVDENTFDDYRFRQELRKS